MDSADEGNMAGIQIDEQPQVQTRSTLSQQGSLASFGGLSGFVIFEQQQEFLCEEQHDSVFNATREEAKCPSTPNPAVWIAITINKVVVFNVLLILIIEYHKII